MLLNEAFLEYETIYVARSLRLGLPIASLVKRKNGFTYLCYLKA